MSVCLSVRPSTHLLAWNRLAPTGLILMEFYIQALFKKSAKKIKF